jgi:hypothetical protein
LRASRLLHIVRDVRAPRLLLAVALLVAVAGCGGDDEASTTATTAATTTASAGNDRLSATSWATYETALAQAQKVNQTAIATFAKCRDLLARDVASEQVEQCFGTTTLDVVSQGQQFLTTLDVFKEDAGGACEKALTDYAGLVNLYIASVNGLTSGDSPSPSQTQVDQASGALVRSRTAARAFEAACKPVA